MSAQRVAVLQRQLQATIPAGEASSSALQPQPTSAIALRSGCRCPRRASPPPAPPQLPHTSSTLTGMSHPMAAGSCPASTSP